MDNDSGKVVKSPVDLGQPVENPALVDAIMAVSGSTTDATQKELLHQLNQANYLVAFNNDELNVVPKATQGKAKIDGILKVLTCSDKEERQLLPVFTDWDAIEAFSEQKLATLVMPSRQLWAFVLDGGYDGVVVNPAGTSVALSSEQVTELQKLSAQPAASAPLDVDAYAGRSRRVR